jgi:CheY-like chemotaxis protein
MAKSILVIDDEELVAVSLKRLLKKEGYNVAVAGNGKEAIDEVKESDFDLIISDVRMPEMDGIEIIKQIRSCLEKSNKKPVPEILITGYADSDKYEEALGLKVTEYLYKPFDNAELLRVVKKTIG